MFEKVLIANRGEIALRIIRGCRDLGVRTVAVHSDADRSAAFVLLADESVEIGPAPSAQSYLVIDRIIDAARATGAQAIHPRYGFLSENPQCARACADNGIVFIGPPADAMAAMGEKVPARERMRESGVPVVPGSGALLDLDASVAAAEQVGYPVLIKASAGGGGIGMRVARSEDELRASYDSARSTAQRAFGNVIHLGERECSIQRRHQKIIEEAPSPVIDAEMRARMGAAAVTAAKAVGYVNAGTVEFIFRDGEFYFLEMNTRLQVEHPVTELVYGIDLVAEQLRIAAGEHLTLRQDEVVARGHAVECRINAENYARVFLPSPGQVTGYHDPAGPGVRVDSSLVSPGLVSPNYDPMIAKLITYATTRGMALDRMRRALLEYVITGIHTNIAYHLAVIDNADFRAGTYSTAFIEQHPELVAEADAWAKRQEPLRRVVRDPARVAAIAAAVAVSG